MSSSQLSPYSFTSRSGEVGRWVLIKKIFELFGYTEDASRAKIKTGVWLKNIHWRKAPDGRIHFNVEAITKWIES